MRKNRKGFTITELVIVIVVIAILAAVLIPTFASLIGKANQSADIQAVRQMNTILAAEGAVEKNNIFEVYDALQEAGMSAENYKPLTADTYFFWDAELDRVLYVDKDNKVLFPNEYKDLVAAERTWVSLTQTIAAVAPNNYVSGTTSAVEVKNGEEMVYVLNDLNSGTSNKNMKITIPSEGIDMKGAAFNVGEFEANAGYNIEITGGPIKNATAVDTAYMGDGKTEGHDGQYGSGLFGYVYGGNTVKIHDVVFENLNVKNSNISGGAILVGGVSSGNVEISNVTIKNSTVIGHRNVGALVGYNAGTVKLSGNIVLENVSVKTIGGRSGLLMGMVNSNGASKFSDTSTIKLINCSYDYYKCEQNTGSKTIGGVTKQLGVQPDGTILSWAVEGDGTEKFKSGSDMTYNANAYSSGTAISFNSIIK